MAKKRVPLYERLPEIYRIRDEKEMPPEQLSSYLALVETVFGEIHKNIEALYDDLFIETCDDWVIPYIGDLLGTSHLTGDAWTLRADVADTIALRRRKGTLASIEQLTYNLTQWGVHCVELRENLVWNHHLNHQRPDEGGDPPYGLPSVTRFTPIRGGTVVLRDPAMLSLLGTAFDPFGHVTDVKPPAFGSLRLNLPNLAIFLWRLKDYRPRFTKPVSRGVQDLGSVVVARFDVHPVGEPVRLFNTYQFNPQRSPPVVTELDRIPGPILRARLTEESEAGNPQAYLAVDTYDPSSAGTDPFDVADVGLQLHLPIPSFSGETWPLNGSDTWTIRGANLCAWEDGLQEPIEDREIVIDPEIGRILVGVQTVGEGTALENNLLVTYTYGAVEKVGAHPLSRPAPPKKLFGDTVDKKVVNYHTSADPEALRKALDNIHLASAPLMIEIGDSMTHVLDIQNIQGRIAEAGGYNLRLAHSLIIRAADGQRPVVKLKRPLRFRPKDPSKADKLLLRLEGLYLTRDDSFPAGEPLIARAALNKLELVGCTLDPGGSRKLDGTRTPIQPSLELREPYGFNAADELAFDQVPEIILQRTIAGPIFIDRGYLLSLSDTILDAGKSVGDDPGSSFAVTGATDPTGGWGPPTQVSGLTVFGCMRVESISGRGGIWVHALEVLNNQQGCIRYSYFSGVGDRLPQNLGCVYGTDATLRFSSEIFGEPGYGQLAWSSDFRIRERGPNDDAMGAFGFLLEAHKWRNIQIRFREFMPVGVRPLLVPVT